MFIPQTGRGRRLFGRALYPEGQLYEEHKHICGSIPGGKHRGGEVGREGGTLTESRSVVRTWISASNPGCRTNNLLTLGWLFNLIEPQLSYL